MRRMLLMGLAVVVVLATVTGVWCWASLRADSELQAWAARQREAGWTVNMGEIRHGGWPLGVTLHVADFGMVTSPVSVPGRLRLAASRASFGMTLLAPHRLSIQLDGEQQIQVGDGPAVPFTADRLVLSLPVQDQVPPREGDLSIEALHVKGPGADMVFTIEGVRAHLDLHPGAGQGQPGVGFSVRAGPILLPAAPAPGGPPSPLPPQLWALGPRIDSLMVDGVVNGPIPRAPDPIPWVTDWRDGGGTVTLRQVQLNWGKLAVTGSATMALDEHLQPMGTATARLTGFSETLAALATAHAIAPRAATAANAVLSLMAQPQDNGPPLVEVPLTLQAGTLQLGRIPLARMPDLQWSSLR